MMFKKPIAVYSNNHMKPTNTLREQNVELLIIKAGNTTGLKGLTREVKLKNQHLLKPYNDKAMQHTLEVY